MPEQAKDLEVVRRVLRGDVDSFGELLDRYQHTLAAVIARYVPHQHVEEVTHLAFIAAFRSLNTYSASGPFKHWLIKISIRRSYDFLRKFRRSREMSLSTFTDEQQSFLDRLNSTESGEAFDDQVSRRAAQELLSWALDRLSPEDRTLITLVELEGYAMADAAEILGWSRTNTKVRAYRARKKLRTLLESMVAQESAHDENN